MEYRVLLCIAHYGTSHQHFLWTMLNEFNRMHPKYVIDVHLDCTDAMLIPKMGNLLPPFDNLRIYEHVYPRDIQFGLTYCHRATMVAKQDEYDLYIYSEDDVLITQKTVDAFMEETVDLPENMVLGCWNYERLPMPDIRKYMVQCHPLGIHGDRLGDVEMIKGRKYACNIVNECQAGYMLTRKQLKKIIASGNYAPSGPHTHWKGEQYYGVPETAAVEPFTVCGLRKVIPLDRMDDFLTYHMRNFYVLHVGETEEQFFQRQFYTSEEVLQIFLKKGEE